MTRAFASGVCALAVIVGFIAVFSYAQEDTTEEANFFPDVAAPAGTVSCFDYYSFGSVQAKLTSSVASTVSGATMTFSGTLENANPYPIVDGALYVKVFKSRGAVNDGNGPDVVDQFFVQEGIAIPANTSVPVTFTWKVPSYAQSGDYRLATFFTTSHKFNLLGLSFTDDVVGNTVLFSVVGEQTERVLIDKASVRVNDDGYRFATFPPRVGTDPVTVRATVRNTADTPQTATISWNIYQWDAQQREHMVQNEHTTVSVPARGSVPISILVRDATYPVYYAVGTLTWKDTKSIIGVRFVRDGVDRLRINFPGVMSFPLRAGQANTLFSCLHNTSDTPILPGGRLELSLTDRNGALIAEHIYDGDVTSDMMGVASAFTPERDYDYVTLNASLYQNSSLVDSAHITYDCQAIDPTICGPKGGNYSLWIVVAFILILLLLFFVLWRFIRRAPQDAQTTMNTN
ncbi:MAG TPA: hypothetical protein VNM40_00945 [Candidatus Paceibacterota bacterium]|nr:hypothetical protein [Candidatus Paceibacterota bacterium]